MVSVEKFRKNSPGYIFGVVLTPFCTDKEILEVAKLKNRIAELHNLALSRMSEEQKAAYIKDKVRNG